MIFSYRIYKDRLEYMKNFRENKECKDIERIRL